MSAIFKTRKTPRHLVIEPERRMGTQPRLRPGRLLLWLLVLALLTGAVMRFLPV